MLRFTLALTLFCATLSSAQNAPVPDYTLTVDVELVQLPVSVLDNKGQPVLGLLREHFNVYEDKVLQDISLFEQEDVPLSVGLVIDASSSMYNKLDRLKAAALTFVRESNPEDETFIVSFGDAAYLEQDFTRSTRELRRSLRTISPHGQTALYDAVQLAAEHLEKGGHEKKVLLVVSDGEDNNSTTKLGRLLEDIRESKIIVYSVGILGEEGLLNRGPFATKAKKALKEFAEVTGGRSFFPKTVNDVDEVCQRIAYELRNQYAIGYKPSNEKLDGSWRKVNVQVKAQKGAPKVQVRTKHGYYAPVAPKRDAALMPDRTLSRR